MPLDCELCGKTLACRSGLTRHYRECHAVRLNPPIRKMACSACSDTFANNEEFQKHIEKTHGVKVLVESKSFESHAEFVEWKKSVEMNGAVKFVEKNRRILGGNPIGGKSYYRCNRDGFFRDRVPDNCRKRGLKLQGSRKLGGHCPARIATTTLSSGRVNVRFYSTHFGHDFELAHLPISSTFKKQIAVQLAKKIPFDTVLDNARKLSGLMNRDNLLNKQDLRNIVRDFGLKNRDAVTSVDAWVEMEQKSSDESCVIFFKGIGKTELEFPDLRYDDFVLCIMTPGQRDILSKHHKIICMDSTDETNAFGYQLTTLITVDDSGQGFPCAFCISNRTDLVGVNVFLRHVKNEVGALSVQVFMSSVAKHIPAAWKDIMGAPSRHVYFSWHVLKAWENKIDTEIKSVKEKKVLLENLRTLLTITDENIFQEMLTNVTKKLTASKNTKMLGEYFEMYAKTSEKWANYLGNTNKHLQKVCGDLKHVFLQGQKVDGIGKTVHSLLHSVNDKLFNKLAALKKEKLSSKIEAVQVRHESTLPLDFDSIVPSDGTWTVFSSSRCDAYTVSQSLTSCSCEIVCRRCKVCIHKFSCTCIDSCVKYNMCKHVHLVARFLAQSRSDNDEDSMDVEDLDGLAVVLDSGEVISDEEMTSKENPAEDSLNNETVEEVEALTSKENPAEDSLNNETVKEVEALKRVALTKVEDFLNRCSSKKDVQTLIDCLDHLSSPDSTPQQQTSDHNYCGQFH